MSSRDELKRKLIDAGLGSVAEQIVQMARPCYRVVSTLAPEEQISLGASRFGGSPDVPADFAWPEGLEFVAQIRLADLPKPLPEVAPHDGLFSFFTRWNEGRVFYFPEGTALQRTEMPPAPTEPTPSGFWNSLRAGLKRKPEARKTYRAGLLRFDAALSPPDGGSSLVDELNLSSADREAYIELCEELWPGDAVKHQMFGHANPVQNEMELECDFLRRGEKPRWDLPIERSVSTTRDWVLLLQLDTDDGKTGPGWMWGDAGMVYFWIHRDDLTARAFDRVIAIEQCH
jgi:uncharacterized protein YwqG